MLFTFCNIVITFLRCTKHIYANENVPRDSATICNRLQNTTNPVYRTSGDKFRSVPPTTVTRLMNAEEQQEIADLWPTISCRRPVTIANHFHHRRRLLLLLGSKNWFILSFTWAKGWVDMAGWLRHAPRRLPITVLTGPDVKQLADYDQSVIKSQADNYCWPHLIWCLIVRRNRLLPIFNAMSGAISWLQMRIACRFYQSDSDTCRIALYKYSYRTELN